MCKNLRLHRHVVFFNMRLSPFVISVLCEFPKRDVHHYVANASGINIQKPTKEINFTVKVTVCPSGPVTGAVHVGRLTSSPPVSAKPLCTSCYRVCLAVTGWDGCPSPWCVTTALTAGTRVMRALVSFRPAIPSMNCIVEMDR